MSSEHDRTQDQRHTRRRRHTEPSGKPVLVTTLILAGAFLLMVLVWRAAMASLS